MDAGAHEGALRQQALDYSWCGLSARAFYEVEPQDMVVGQFERRQVGQALLELIANNARWNARWRSER